MIPTPVTLFLRYLFSTQMSKKIPDLKQPAATHEQLLEKIRKQIKKQELQTNILKSIIATSEDQKQTDQSQKNQV